MPDEPASIPRDVVEDAIRKHLRLSLRGEKHAGYGVLFVDAHYLDALDSPDWQVVYGRRGTGKTILLGALEDRLNTNLEEFRSLPLRLSAEDAIVAPPYGAEFDEGQRVLGYFETFLENLGDELATATEPDSAPERPEKQRFFARLLGSPPPSATGTSSNDDVEKLIAEVVAAVQTGTLVSAFSQVVVETEEHQGEQADRRSGVRGSVGLSGTGSRASVEAELGTGRASESGQSTRRSTTGSPVARFRSVRDGLIRIAELLDLERIVVLIDEWSVLDPSDQPEFADLLRKAFGGTDRVSVKVATDRHNTRFSDRPRHGLELQADIFEAMNLDRAALSEPDLNAFFEELLFKRLLFKENRLTAFAGEGGGSPSESFLPSIFADDGAFTELVRGSAGIPREFLIVFNRIAQERRYSTEPRWTREDVHRGLRAHTLTISDQLPYDAPAARLLTTAIKTHVVAHGSRIFTIRRADEVALGDVLEELLSQRLIHEVPPAAVRDDVRDEYGVYRLSYGLWLDWERTRALRGDTAHDDAEDPSSPLTRDQADHLAIEPPRPPSGDAPR